jgi:hypothetical protein
VKVDFEKAMLRRSGTGCLAQILFAALALFAIWDLYQLNETLRSVCPHQGF